MKVLFLIHDLGQGGAEKVLVNLVNNMDPIKFDITVVSLFGGGVNEQFLKPHIKYRAVWPKAIPGNSMLMKLLTPAQLHALCVKGRYDIEISYLEGPSARVISGCRETGTKLVSWIHSNRFSEEDFSRSFRSISEARACYNKFDRIICVSQFMKDNFNRWMPDYENCEVLYNTVESDKIRELSLEEAKQITEHEATRLCAVGSLKKIKGYDRLLRIALRLKDDGYLFRLFILGVGPLENELSEFVKTNELTEYVHFLGYQTNPYRFVSKCDMLICSSYSEGFSTAATEALIVGTPVCTVEVSGMKELLGDNNEYGVVTENSEEALYQGIKRLLEDPALLARYREKAAERGLRFCTKETVQAVEDMLLKVSGEGHGPV